MAANDSISGEAVANTGTDSVFSVNIYLPFRIVRTVELYFPADEHHSNIDSGNTNGNLASYAQLAGKFLKTGKWSGWFGNKSQEANVKFSDVFLMRVEASVSDSAKEAQREWRSTVASKNVRTILKKARENIDTLKRKHLKAKELSEIKMPDFWDERERARFGLPSLNKISGGISAEVKYVHEEQSRFRKLHAEEVRKRKMYWSKLKELRGSYGENLSILKRNLVTIFGSQQRRDTIEYLQNLAQEALRSGSSDAARVFQEEIRVWISPFAAANGALGAIKSVAEELRDWICDAILGAKAPNISNKTIENRVHRGHPPYPPLNETGEFAESLRYRII